MYTDKIVYEKPPLFNGDVLTVNSNDFCDPKNFQYSHLLRTVRCHLCKSELEVNYKDISYKGEEGDWRENGWAYYWSNCKACGFQIDVEEKDIPLLVRVKIQKRCKSFWFKLTQFYC